MADEARLRRVLVQHSLAAADEPIALVPLGGGVSCDVFRVDLRRGPICVKQALPRLRVAAKWEVAPERAHVEAEWLRLAGRIGVPAPEVLFEDREQHLLGMAFCESTEPWKARLARGEADATFAAAVGDVLARMHRATRGDAALAEQFANGDLFEALRIDPFILHCAQVHPQHAEMLRSIADTTRREAAALIHGDFSPKNILYRSEGPVILDAECATWGDPAFDLAFCVTHLLLKSRWRSEAFAGLVEDARSLVSAYRAGVGQDLSGVDLRAAALVAALLLARVDGKSPVDYLGEADRVFVRRTALEWLAQGPRSLDAMFADWINREGSK